MNSRATQLKFGCPRMSHYASHYHYGSQSIACSNQWEFWGSNQPVNSNCINLHKHNTPHCTAKWTYCPFLILWHRRIDTIIILSYNYHARVEKKTFNQWTAFNPHTQQKTHCLFRAAENRIVQSSAAHVVHSCQQYYSALLHLIAG